MAGHTNMRSFDNLKSLVEAHAVGESSGFAPTVLQHIYIKLDFRNQYEIAQNAEDARGFLRSVARASMAAAAIAEAHGGVLLEVQGSMLHVGIPYLGASQGSLESESSMLFAGDLHQVYKKIFERQGSRVDGWRMTIDVGQTLVVSGMGVHGDSSLVSLGDAANRPAKYLYAQLALAEDKRQLKRFTVGVRNPGDERWSCLDLDRLHYHTKNATSVADAALAFVPAMKFMAAGEDVAALSLPISPAGTPGSPSAERPATHFGWVMRSDLDGFTQRVRDCFGSPEKLQSLANEFRRIMNAASQFVASHSDHVLAQLPWAGDNFTVAAVFGSKEDYDKGAQKGHVDLALAFEKEMAESASPGSLEEWAYGIAGGDVHGNANGNVYLGSVQIPGRRFLIGAGEGFGRSAQAFADINPRADEIVAYSPDVQRMDARYKRLFETRENTRGQQSTLFMSTNIDPARRARLQASAAGSSVIVTKPQGRTEEIPSRPYFQ